MLLHYRLTKGFTLIEALVVITIIAVLAFLAYPSMSSIVYRLEANRIKNIFFDNIKIAKATSYSYHKNVTMCLLNEQGQCHRDGNQQLILFFDKNNNNNYEENQDTVIESTELNLKYATTYGRMGGRHYVRFASNTGVPRGFFGHFKYCPLNSNNENLYQISFNQVGIITYKPNKNHPTNCPNRL